MISVVIISKDEESLDGTLIDVTSQAGALEEPSEVVVVDASDGRLDHIRLRHENHVRWLQFQQPPGVRVSIPHQRNVGVRAAHGEIIVFTDAGCQPEPEWLVRLVAPLLQDEHITAGLDSRDAGRHQQTVRSLGTAKSDIALSDGTWCQQLCFHREVFDAVGGFDERFPYGEDTDFCWRLANAGYQIRGVPEAVIRHDWGTTRRQFRRSYLYGKARVRLYRKHPARLRHDPVTVVYPLFLLGLPLTLIFPFYPALLLIPAWRNRSDGPVRVVVEHLVYGSCSRATGCPLRVLARLDPVAWHRRYMLASSKTTGKVASQ